MDYPYLKSWWINHGQILAGRCPCDLKSDVESQMLQSLVELGITHFINLQEEDERVGGKLFKDYMPEARSYALGKGRELGFHRFPITDQTVSRVSNMIACLNHIDEVLAQAGKPYVHCWGGNGRTGTVIGCWLVRQGMSPNDAGDVQVK